MPSNLKILRGNPGKRALPVREPKLRVEIPESPATFGPIGRSLWTELSELLRDMRVLTKADRRSLELTCQAYEQYRLAKAIIDKRGFTYESETQNGHIIRARPEVQMCADAWRRVMKGLVDFGLTPSSRTKVQTVMEPKRDPFESFLGRGKKTEDPTGPSG